MCVWERKRTRMIAAQLLAYYFTELKDDQVKKVSALSILWCCVCLNEWEKLMWRKGKDLKWEESGQGGEESMFYRGHWVHSFGHHQNSGVLQCSTCKGIFVMQRASLRKWLKHSSSHKHSHTESRTKKFSCTYFMITSTGFNSKTENQPGSVRRDRQHRGSFA